MTSVQHTAPVMQLRVALTTSDYARLVQFYCAGLGLEPAQVWMNNDDRSLMLEMGQATPELFDDGYAPVIRFTIFARNLRRRSGVLPL